MRQTFGFWTFDPIQNEKYSAGLKQEEFNRFSVVGGGIKDTLSFGLKVFDQTTFGLKQYLHRLASMTTFGRTLI